MQTSKALLKASSAKCAYPLHFSRYLGPHEYEAVASSSPKRQDRTTFDLGGHSFVQHLLPVWRTIALDALFLRAGIPGFENTSPFTEHAKRQIQLI
jgi:hypothetical protein